MGPASPAIDVVLPESGTYDRIIWFYTKNMYSRRSILNSWFICSMITIILCFSS